MPDALLEILMITYNRASKTALSLQRLLETCEPGMRVWVWHNGSDAKTQGIVESFRGHPAFAGLHLSAENRKLREPTNWFWQRSGARFFSKVDDDCLLPDGWATTLIQAHESEPRLGIIGCWRFYDEDFVPSLAEQKIRTVADGHQIMANCWVQGSGYVMKREVFEQLGPLRPSESFTDYGIRAALAGRWNGWYFPFLHEEHMDDPRSPYSEFRTEVDFQRGRPLSAINDDVRSLEEWKMRVRWMARSVQSSSSDPRQHVGWRAQLRRGVRRVKRLGGWQEPWRLPR